VNSSLVSRTGWGREQPQDRQEQQPRALFEGGAGDDADDQQESILVGARQNQRSGDACVEDTVEALRI